jgi:hypothetical protein
MNARDLHTLLSGYRLRSPNEATLQFAIAQCLDQNGVKYDREWRLTAEDRVDFMVDAVALEVKVDGSPAEVTRQIHRYAQHQAVQEILLVTTRAQHLSVMPSAFNGKPIFTLWVGGSNL